MYTIYKTTNRVNHRYYIGIHKTNKPHDGYLGSGKAIKSAIKRYGRHNFSKEVLFITEVEQEAYAKEVELVSFALLDPRCYNMNEGGRGGFTLINKNRHLYPNPMKDPVIKAKNQESRIRNTTPESLERKKLAGQANIRKAIAFNLGRKRPRQSKLKSEINKGLWQDADFRNRNRDANSKNFIVTSPLGESHETNRLIDFCVEYDLVYPTLILSSQKNGQVVKKGKCKGWKCTVAI